MRSSRSLIMLGLALVAGLLAAWLAVRWMDVQVSARSQASTAQVTKVAVAAEALRAGREISDKSIQLIVWPAGSLPEGAITEGKDVVGRIVKSPVAKGEVILEAKLAARGARGGLAAVLAPGKRAISVGVNEVVGVAAESLEGSYVDVMVNSTDNSDAERQRSISKIVLERVKVLAVPVSQNNSKINAVTLEVSPDEAERIDLARSVGTLSLVLRGQDEPDPDSKPSNTRGATKEALFGGPVRQATVATPRPAVQPSQGKAVAPAALPTPIAPPPAAGPKACVEAYVGSEKRSECF